MSAQQASTSLRDAVSGDLTGLEGRARRLADRLDSGSDRVCEAYAEAQATLTNHLARLSRLRDQLDVVVRALGEARGAE